MSTWINLAAGRLAGLLSLLVAMSPLCAGCDGLVGIEGSGTIATEDRTVEEAFDTVELRGSPTVVIQIDPDAAATSLAVTTDDNLLEYVETNVSGSALVIGTSERISPTRGIQVQMTVPSLAAVRLSGSGDIHVSGITGKAFSARIYGSGDIRLAGEVEGLELTVTGSGDIKAEDVDAGNVRAQVTGSGDISLQARGRAEVSITGSGDIAVHGQPAELSSSVTGSGSVRTR